MFGRFKVLCATRRRMVVSVVVVLGLLWLGNRFWQLYRARDAAGIYLVDGGRYLIVLEHSSWTGLRISEGAIRIHPGFRSDGARTKASFRGGEIVYSQTQWVDIYGGAGPGSELDRMDLRLNLAPSESITGDWDLVNGKFDYQRAWSLKEFGKRLSGLVDGRGFGGDGPRDGVIVVPYNRDDPPLRSYFHRVDDARLREYFELRKAWGPSKEQRDIVESILEDHPGDPYLELHAIEMEALVGDADKADKMLTEWKERNPEDPRDPLSQSAYLVGNTVSLAMAEKRGYPKDSMRYFFAGTASRPTTARWEERLEWLKKLVDYTYLTPEVLPLMGDLWPDASSEIPNYLEMQVATKTVCILSDFALLQGNREESLALLAGSYRLGQSMSVSHFLISRLIGFALRGIACNGLDIYVLNACETPEDFEECWEMIQKLSDVPYQNDGRYMVVDELPSYVDRSEKGLMIPNFLEVEIRAAVTDARFEIVRGALAAKYHLVRTNEFPAKDTEFGPFFEKGLPKDPFGDESIKYRLKDADRFCVYSIGPDKGDDLALVAYDSTNGTISAGDIYLDIPREREFPFPRDGVKAKNASELLAQFPNGLPTDVYGKSMYGKYPLSIIESSNNTPVMVVSCGPDQNHAKPVNEAASVPAGTTNESFFRQEECVFLPFTGASDAPVGYWCLQPVYDPSNGTTSQGDIFMEVER